MVKRMAIGISLLLSALLLSSNPILRAQDNWTCDDGPQDVLNAAQDAFDQGDNARALELVQIAESICRRTNATRAGQTVALHAQIELATRATPTPRRTATSANKDRADELYERGAAFYRSGRYAEALAAFEEALEIFRQIKDRQGEAETLNAIGLVYRVQGQLAKALDYYNRALVIVRETHDWQGKAVTLNNIGVVYRAQGQYAKALDYYQQSLIIRREIKDRQGEAVTLNNIGAVFRAQGQHAKALDYYQQALVIRRETRDRAGEGITLNSIGLTYQDLGQYAKALDYLNQALGIRRETRDRAGEGITLGNIGLVYNRQGQYAKALDYLNQALGIRREVKDRTGEGVTLHNIGLAYAGQGQYAKALDYYNQALDIHREVHNRAEEGHTLYNIGWVYHMQEQYTRALDYYNQALAITQEVGDRAGGGTALNSIGGVYQLQGQYAKALDYYNQALSIAREVGDRAGEGATLHNIGWVYNAQGQLAKALDYYNRALVVQREIGARAGEGVTLNNIGTTYKAQKQYAKALDYYNQALGVVREIGDRAGETTALWNRGLAYEWLRQNANAVTDYRAAIDIAEGVLDDAALDNAIASLSSQNSWLYQRLAILLIADGQAAEALAYVERGRAVLVRRDLAGKPVDFQQADQPLLQKETELKAALDGAQKYLDNLRKDGSAAADIRQAQAALDKARRDYQQHLETMQLRGGFVARQFSRQVASLDQIRAALPLDTTLVLFQVGDPNSFVFLITGSTLDVVVLEVSATQIAEQVKVFTADRKAMADTSLRKLYDQVIAPLKDKLKTKRLLIAPDGALNVVPFAALKTAEGRYLIDDYAISLIPSATALVLLKERQPAGKATSPGLVLAQPAAPNLPAIQHAKLEAESVGKLLGLTPRLDASESDLRKQATGSRVIYLAAHAELDRFAPLFGVVYLKGDQQHDGRFEVREVYELDLSQGTELVVLSGCNTASGGTGEEFGVMTRAFFGAGAPRVVGSLWSVDDVATADLLTTYMLLRDKLHSDVDALQAAMIKTRQQYPEPYYWAGFVLTGLP